jgi:cell division protein FtsW
MAWLLSLRELDKSLPIFPMSAIVTGAVAFLLMKQPDFGSTIIFGSCGLPCLRSRG